MSVLNALLLAPTVNYPNTELNMWIGIIVSVVVAIAVYFVFFLISGRVHQKELAEAGQNARQSENDVFEETATEAVAEAMAEETQGEEATVDEEVAPETEEHVQPIEEEVAPEIVEEEPIVEEEQPIEEIQPVAEEEPEVVVAQETETEAIVEEEIPLPVVEEVAAETEEYAQPVEEEVATDTAEEVQPVVEEEQPMEEVQPVAEEEPEAVVAQETETEAVADEGKFVQPAEEEVATDTAEEVQPVVEQEAAAVVPAAIETEEPVEEEDLPLPEFIDKILAEFEEEDARAFEYYVVNNSEPIKTRIKYPLGQYKKEKDFLKDFFVSYAKYKKLLSADVFEKLYTRYARTIRDDHVRTKLNNKLINVLYFYRKANEENIDKCRALCKKDIELNFDKIDVRDCRVPALKRLILIEAAEKNYDAALRWCELALSRNIFDKKEEGFEARKEKLEAKREKQRIKEEKQRKKLEGKKQK